MAKKDLLQLQGGTLRWEDPLAGTATQVNGEVSTPPTESAPWRVRVTPPSSSLSPTTPLNLRSSPNAAADAGNIVTAVSVGTELEVTGSRYVNGDRGLELWFEVETADGETGFVKAGRFETLSGVASFPPYVLSDGRDGSTRSAKAHASSLVGAGTEYGAPSDGSDSKCLGFVNDCFGITQAPDRCPEMSNPAPYEGSAWGAFQKLQENGHIMTARPIPDGAIVFFERTEDNGQNGHVAIVTGDIAPDGSPYVLTSGWENSPEVKRMSLTELEAATGAVVGYTTPEEAFTNGTYGGGREQEV
ncbi:SH3 domain-containing protein [Myxococcus sp. AM001]|nr:SH3 domain-containing protein [Myxococcus sp. AM001]